MMNKMSLKEFRDKGFLLEANRQFFHPLGLALTVYFDEGDMGNERGIDTEVAGPIGLFIQDYRNDPEGFLFSEFSDEDIEKVEYVKKLKESKMNARINLCGDVVQPLISMDKLDQHQKNVSALRNFYLEHPDIISVTVNTVDKDFGWDEIITHITKEPYIIKQWTNSLFAKHENDNRLMVSLKLLRDHTLSDNSIEPPDGVGKVNLTYNLANG